MWSVLYPSWPGLVLLLWAVVIWVIPRVNPKQLLQYSSPLLVVYAIGLLLLSFVNALPVTSNGFTWGFKVGIECKFTDDNIQDCLSGALGIKVSQEEIMAKKDTIGAAQSVLIKEVSSFQSVLVREDPLYCECVKYHIAFFTMSISLNLIAVHLCVYISHSLLLSLVRVCWH